VGTEDIFPAAAHRGATAGADPCLPCEAPRYFYPDCTFGRAADFVYFHGCEAFPRPTVAVLLEDLFPPKGGIPEEPLGHLARSLRASREEQAWSESQLLPQGPAPHGESRFLP